MDPELARYLDRNFWQRKSNDSKQTTVTTSTTTPSAPVANTEPKQAGGGIVIEVKVILPLYLSYRVSIVYNQCEREFFFNHWT
jgi:hypothetical protein